MRTLLLTTAAAMLATAAAAYDFMAGGIAYNVNADGKTVSVTYTKYGNNYPGVTSLAIPERVTNGGKEYKVTRVGGYAFYECASLVSLSLPATVTAIDEYGMFACERLTTVVMGINVAEIGQYAFSETALTALTLPSSVVSIGDYAYSGCGALTAVDTGSGVRQVGRSAFRSCARLQSLTLGVNVAAIGVNAFAGDAALGRITCGMAEPPEIDASVFSNVNKLTCKLYVPSGTVELYSSAEVWKEFVNLTDDMAGYALTAPAVNYVRANRDFLLSISLDNESQVTSLLLDLTLPAGLSISRSGGSPLVWLDEERRARDHALTVNGNRILVSSPSGKAFKGNQGPLLHVWIAVDDTQADNSQIRLENISLSTVEGVMVTLGNETVPFDVYYLRGDANGDGDVDVADYVVMANRLVDNAVSRFFLDAADVNRNGYPDVADLTGITQHALDKITPELVKK